MIVVPPGWSATVEADGLELVHAGGREVAVIEYRERMRPLLKVGALLRERPLRVERLVTDEGEYAALATHGDAHVQRDVGFVFGDDFYARISAVCFRAELFADMTKLVRELVIGDTHMLGVRRRRFMYAPPPGWQGRARGFITDWMPREFPREKISLTVYPAMPVERAPNELLASMLVPRRADADVIDERTLPLGLPNGLAGDVAEAVWSSAGQRVAKLCCVLRDRSYAYPLEATADHEDRMRAHRDVLDRVLASVEPIPQPRTPGAQAGQSYWIE